MKKPRGYILDGAHVLADKRPSKKTQQALRAMIAAVRKIEVVEWKCAGFLGFKQ